MEKKKRKWSVENIPFEIKVLASLRHLGRGECWDTIVELCNDLTCITTLSKFFKEFTKAMCEVYGDVMIHPPRTSVELESVLTRSERRGFPGCVGFLDGVHVHWDKCPNQWRHHCVGKNDYPTIGWQCCVNHKRRFISVGKGHYGSVNDKTAVKYDDFIKELRERPLYRDFKYMVYDQEGNPREQTGLWVNVDGGYIKIPQCLVGDPEILHVHMNYWTTLMESERKHVECAFGILKSRFRILKLPIRMHDFDEIDEMFRTCCILHNMCLEYDHGDDEWNLGSSTVYGGDPRRRYGQFSPGQDGYFSDDDNHRYYWSGGLFYDIHEDIDYSYIQSLSFPQLGSKRDTRQFNDKREQLSQHWYYMYRQKMIDWDY